MKMESNRKNNVLKSNGKDLSTKLTCSGDKDDQFRKDKLDLQKSIDKNKAEIAKDLVHNAKEVLNTVVKSRETEMKTRVELTKIDEKFRAYDKVIVNEYGKQKAGMDVASKVVDYGLENNDLNHTIAGLNALTGIVNHNPVSSMMESLNDSEKDDDYGDDSIIEI